MPSLVNINSISPSLRDFLIGLSLHPITATVTNNNLSNLLGSSGGYTGVGLPFTVNYISSVTPIPLLETLGGAAGVLRPPLYAINQYQGVVSSTQNDYEDAGGVIGAPLTITNLPNSGGTSPYGLSILTSTPPNLYSPNPTPDDPYTSLSPGLTPYIYNVGKNTYFKSDKNYKETYFKANPDFPAINLVVDDNGKPYGPNFNYNLYKGSKDEVVYAGNQIYAPIGVTNQKEGYLDANGKLNVGGPSAEPYNTISSLLKGGVGFNKNGGGGLSLVNNNDVRNTIVGRALTAGGLINDTSLGIIGAQRLAISLANNAAFKLQKETIGRVNLDIFSWIDGKKDDFIVPNYEITVPAGKFGKTLDFLGDLAGFTRPKSQMKTDFFSFDDKFTPTLIGNIARANGMLETTGKGQVIALFRNIQANLLNSNFIRQGYAPGIVNKRMDGDDAIRHNVYAYGNPDGEILENTDLNIPDSAVYGNGRWTDTDGSGFEGEYFNFKTGGNGGNTEGLSTESDFVWSDDKFNDDRNEPNDLIAQADNIFGDSPSQGETNSLYQPNRKSILYKTKELFKSGNMSTLVNGHGIYTEKSQIQSAVVEGAGGYIMSKGNAALTRIALDGNFKDYSKIFCRTWTPMDKYDQVNDLVRHRSIDKNGGTYARRNPLSEYSVLENTGFVKIAQYVSDTGSVRRHMFSIENLAFKDIGNLPKCEQGPNLGRIMWFPPYDIKFSESTSVNWDKHNFIGRGEPMYTYNNTERTGQLSFKIIIDHPNQLNVEKSNIISSDEEFYSFFAGCNPLEILTPEQQIEEEIAVLQKTEVQIADTPPLPSRFTIFYPNDNWEYPNDNPEYESGLMDAAGANKIKVIKDTAADGDNGPTYVKDNAFMGYPDATTKKKTLGPASPLGLSPVDYNTKKINYDFKFGVYNLYAKGNYLGLGMTTNKDVTLSNFTKIYVDRTNYGLNANRHDVYYGGMTDEYALEIPNVGKWSGWLAGNDVKNTVNKSFLDALKENMAGPCKDCVIEIFGFASTQGSVDKTKQKNLLLSKRRAENARRYLLDKVIDPNDPLRESRIVITEGEGQTDEYNKFATYVGTDGTAVTDKCDEGEKNKSPQDSLGCKLNRRVVVKFRHVPELRNKPSKKPVSQKPITPQAKKTIVDLVNSTYKECGYFNKLSTTDPVTYSKITDKIKFFTPAFHSTTPEGFNARLTFLQQCTRQGPSVYPNVKPDNLVFGRPPVCVLRIGDFYNTKIIIESLSFDFEPLVWDLNPEGIGVQPMIANVSMNFAFIGGSSLDGPIAKLQNGISRNYFANTGLYDMNADVNSPAADLDKTIADAAFEKPVNERLIIPDNTKNVLPTEDKALTSEKLDLEILQAGVLSLSYDDSGIFQGKVKGKFTIKSKLSKEYTVKLRTKPDFTNDTNNLGAESIDAQKIKLNELKVSFESKRKTTNSVQRWDNYFTDTYDPFKGNKNVLSDKQYIYEYVNLSLQDYVTKKTIDKNDMTGNEADGWDYLSHTFYEKPSDYNYNFYIDVEGLGSETISLPFKGRWVPNFKVDKNAQALGTTTLDTFGSGLPHPDKKLNYSYTYEAYLSGGKLDIVNEKNKSADEVSAQIESEADIKKQIEQDKAKAKKDKKKEDKTTKKANKEKQKALVKDNKGTLI